MVNGKIRMKFRKEGVVIELPLLDPIKNEEVWSSREYSYDEISARNLSLHITSVRPVFRNEILMEIQLEGTYSIPHFSKTQFNLGKQDEILIKLPNSFRDYPLIPIPKKHRRLFPGYKIPFILETDIGEIETHITSAPEGVAIGDPEAGTYIRAGIPNWANAHPELTGGDYIKLTVLEPGKRYRLDCIPKSSK